MRNSAGVTHARLQRASVRVAVAGNLQLGGVRPLALLASAVPGMGYFVSGQRKLGVVIFAVWLSLMLAYFAYFGSGRGFFLGTMAVSLHCGSVCALLSGVLSEQPIRFRAATGLLVYIILLVLFYGPMYWGTGQLVGVLPAPNMRASGEIHEGDIVLHTGPWLKPLLHRGDLVAYRVRETQHGNVRMAAGVLLDRIIGEPGDTVELRGGRMLLNGTLLPPESMPIGRGMAVTRDFRTTAGPDDYILIPSTLSRQGGAMPEQLADVLERSSRVPRGDVLGRIFWRVGPGFDSGPIRNTRSTEVRKDTQP